MLTAARNRVPFVCRVVAGASMPVVNRMLARAMKPCRRNGPTGARVSMAPDPRLAYGMLARAVWIIGRMAHPAPA